MTFDPAVNNALLVGLTKAANHLVIKMKDRVRSNGLPDKISNAMSIGTAQLSGAGNASIEIIISLDPDTGAPMAAAFEWGSGLHATRYSPQLYPIPVTKPGPLHFYWENRGKWFFGAKLPFGHPGVAPKPYIEPTVREELGTIQKIIGQEIKVTIITSMKEINL